MEGWGKPHPFPRLCAHFIGLRVIAPAVIDGDTVIYNAAGLPSSPFRTDVEGSDTAVVPERSCHAIIQLL